MAHDPDCCYTPHFSWCTWTDAHFCRSGEKLHSSCWKYLAPTYKIYSRWRPGARDVCTPALKESGTSQLFHRLHHLYFFLNILYNLSVSHLLRNYFIMHTVLSHPQDVPGISYVAVLTFPSHSFPVYDQYTSAPTRCHFLYSLFLF